MYDVMQADILQEKLETYLMADKIRWLHFGATARPFGALLLITPLTAGVVATFQLIGSRTSELGELESELLVNLSYVAMAGLSFGSRPRLCCHCQVFG